MTSEFERQYTRAWLIIGGCVLVAGLAVFGLVGWFVYASVTSFG